MSQYKIHYLSVHCKSTSGPYDCILRQMCVEMANGNGNPMSPASAFVFSVAIVTIRQFHE